MGPPRIREASLPQRKAMAMVPKCTSALSLLGSTYIIYDVLRMPPNERRVYDLLLLGMSCFDLLSTGGWFFSTWPIPPEVFPAYGAMGTQQTCTAQGFFTQLTLATVLYNGSLAAYYFMVIFWGWSDTRLEHSKVEYLFHAIAITAGLGTSSAGVAMEMFNPMGWDCWLSSVPLNCQQSWLNNGETTCIRGDNANLWQWVFFFIPMWAVVLFTGTTMAMIVRKFQQQEQPSRDRNIPVKTYQDDEHPPSDNHNYVE
jgi:hypothetical protein